MVYLDNHKEAIKIFTGVVEKFPLARGFIVIANIVVSIRGFVVTVRDFEKAIKLVYGK